MFQISPSTPPDRSTRPASADAAGDVDPVPRLSEQHRVEGCVGQRHPLRTPDESRHTGHVRSQFSEHRRIGIDRDDLGAEPRDDTGELAGAGTHVSGSQRASGVVHRLQHPLDGLERIVRPAGLVGARLRPEREGHLLAICHGPSLRRAVRGLLKPWTSAADRRTPDGYEQEFDARFARRLAREYRHDGLTPSARRIVDFADSNGLAGASVLEIGGGIGDIQVELLLHGASRTTNLELSGAYEAEAARLLDEQGLRGRATRVLGVDLAVSPDAVEPADIVILHRVVCCYPDYDALLTAAARHARRAVIFSHPPRTWFTRALLGAANLMYRLTGNPYRAFAHSPESMIEVLGQHGFEPRYRYRDRVWSVVGAVRA